MLSCPTGGGHGRSLITLISTASTAPGHQRRDDGERTETRGTNGGEDRKTMREKYREEKEKVKKSESNRHIEIYKYIYI